MPPQRRGTSRRDRERNKRVIEMYGGICFLCGHPGADAADHVIPMARGGADDLSNLRPAHHTEPCATCGERCNRRKNDKVVPPIIRRSGTLNR